MRHHNKLLGLFVLSALVAGCSRESALPDAAGPGFAVNVAPLQLEGVADACYELTVFGGADTNAPMVWQRGDICSSRYGDGRGSLSYVGTCDADVPTNTVRLILEDLCSTSPCGPTYPGPNSLPVSSWRNPCPGPLGCIVSKPCAENRDTPVEFNLVVSRSANQGFFDIGVNFSDVFCSAKLDCVDEDEGPLYLLFDPSTTERGPTVVVAWACTAGPGAQTHLYYDNLVVSCFDDQNQLIGSWPYDPSLGPGNAGPGSAPFVFQTGIYRTETQTSGVLSWNVALGIRPDELPGRCVLTARATASEAAFVGQATPAGAVYPFVSWNVELSSGPGALTCTRHPLDVEGSGVETDYVRQGDPVPFSHKVSTGNAERVASLGLNECADTYTTSDVAFFDSPEGVAVRVGKSQSPFYPLPAGLHLQGCCGNPCCGDAPIPP